jgi:hypothetical protein
MPAFSVATDGDLACFARGVNVGVAARCDQARPERRIDQQQEKGPVCESSERPHDLREYSISKEGVQITSKGVLENSTEAK